jgi:uncharacterized paraquat-inducible protein A
MDRIPTISDTTQARAHTGNAPDVCWCGQDIEHGRAAHCPRCGTACATRLNPTLARLAA